MIVGFACLAVGAFCLLIRRDRKRVGAKAVMELEVSLVFAIGIFFVQNRIIQVVDLHHQLLALGLALLMIIIYTGGKPALLAASTGKNPVQPDPPLNQCERRMVKLAPWVLIPFVVALGFWFTW